jgi:hypothetical protein
MDHVGAQLKTIEQNIKVNSAEPSMTQKEPKRIKSLRNAIVSPQCAARFGQPPGALAPHRGVSQISETNLRLFGVAASITF